jgi:hypothetical protein
MTYLPLLLADPSPSLRYLVLRELYQRPMDDPEVRELDHMRAADPLIRNLIDTQNPDGSWESADPRGAIQGEKLYASAQVMVRFGYMGYGPDHHTVQRGAEFIFSHQLEDGSWPLPASRTTVDGVDGYSMIPLQTAIPLRGLAACGFSTDPSAERAFEWLLSQRLDDGAWPVGIAAGNYGYIAGYRRLPHSRWGCRSNTSAALICLSLHPQRSTSQPARRALEHMLGRETREQYTLGYEVARTIGVEKARGFLTYFARFDPALILDLCWRSAASAEDPRISDLIAFIRGLQGPYGLWEYIERPQVSRWLTFDLLRSLSQLDKNTAADWFSLEPRTPFQPYPKPDRRY